jgi:hypothetical protein
VQFSNDGTSDFLAECLWVVVTQQRQGDLWAAEWLMNRYDGTAQRPARSGRLKPPDVSRPINRSIAQSRQAAARDHCNRPATRLVSMRQTALCGGSPTRQSNHRDMSQTSKTVTMLRGRIAWGVSGTSVRRSTGLARGLPLHSQVGSTLLCAQLPAQPHFRSTHAIRRNPIMLKLICHAVAALVVALPAHLALAADSGSTAPSDKLSSARALIAEKKWSPAVSELKRLNDVASADWNNLMGYTHRKLSPPDLASAERYYDEALRIDAQHRGALQYSGELYLLRGDLAKAEQRLASLDKSCMLPCREFTDLKNAVQSFKQNGNKYVPAQ